MRTEHLIAELASDPAPVPAAGPRLALALGAGLLVAMVGLMAAFGSPLTPVSERGLAGSALKLVYPLIFAFFGAAAALASGRPGDRAWLRLLPVCAALLLLVAMSADQLSTAHPSARQDLLFGSTWERCVSAVVLSSIPIFACLVWGFKILAPTRPAFAGFLIGLASGGSAAAAYALFCPETSRAFLLGAYMPAMLVPAALGALMGPKILRW